MPPKKQKSMEKSKSMEKPKPIEKPKPLDCDLCCKHIVEGREEAIQCEGACGLWFHRYCAGVSVPHFKELTNSSEPFVCYVCYQRSQLIVTNQLRSEVAHLKDEISKLAGQLAQLSSAPVLQDETTVSHLPTRNINKSGCGSNAPTHVSALKQSVNLSASPSASNSANVERKANAVDKRFNIVIYGLVECPKGSPRHVRLSHDTDLACKTIKSVCPDLSDYAVCDCVRIGKYSDQRSRPLIVRFARSCDAVNVLSNRHRLSKVDCPNVSLKPFMSIAERKTESILLKERRALIDSGVERKYIKIRGNSIYVNNIKVGSANKDSFVRHKTLQGQSQDNDTSIVISTNVASNNHSQHNATNTDMSTYAANNAALSPTDSKDDMSTHVDNNATMSSTDTNDVMSTSEEPKHKTHTQVIYRSSSPLSTNSN